MPDNSRLINVNITFRNTASTEPLKQYATDKLSNCLRKFVHQDIDLTVVLSVEKNRQIAEVTFYADGSDFKVKHESLDLYASIDGLCDSLTQQLRKNKEKLTGH